MNMETL